MKTIIFVLKLLVSDCCLVILIHPMIYAQVNQEWVARYNNISSDVATSTAVDGSGNVYVTGISLGNGTNTDYATIKYNSSGIQQWVQRYNGPFNSTDNALSIALDGSGNVYVTGLSFGSGTSEDYATIKYSTSGVQLWVQRYNGPSNSTDIAFSIALDDLGNVYVIGYSSGSGTGYDYATIKYNSSGVQQWVQRYNGPGNSTDEAYSIAVDDSGNVYVTGYSTGSGTGYDYATIKYNSSGVQQWVQRYNGPSNSTDEAYSIAVDGSGNVYVTGNSLNDYLTIKYDSSGVSQWVKRYNGIGDSIDNASSIAVDGSGNVYITGSSQGNGTYYDYATIKYNSSGIQQWVQRYNGPGNLYDQATSMALDGSGNVYVTGYSSDSGTGYDYATIKYNSSGVQQWMQRYNGPGNSSDEVYSIALDGSSNVYVTGYSYGSGTNIDYATIKYSQSIGIKQISSVVPEQFSLSQNYPNPFNPSTNIKFDLRKKSFVKLIIYNSIGKEVTTLVNVQMVAGSFQVDWDAGNYPSGVYFYKIETENYTNSKRMILLK